MLQDWELNMSKNKELVQQALDEKEVKDEAIAEFRPIVYSYWSRSRLRRCYDYNKCDVSPRDYPVNMTDQTHALSIAEQVRRGLGDAEKPDPKAFDFPDGKDDGSEAHGIFEFANRVDAWVAEQNLSDELKQSFRSQVLQQQADKAASETIKSVTDKVDDNVKTLDKNADSDE